MEDNILRITEDSAVYSKLALEFIERKIKFLKILNTLPRLDCKDCKLESCEEMAVAIYQRKAKFTDCKILKSKSKLKTKLIINNAEVLLNPFVSEFTRNSILGMVSSLKGVSIKGDEKIHVEILS